MGKLTTKRLRAFTLQELLVVLIIIGILTLLVLPNLLPMITKAKSTEAQLQLKHLQTLEKSHFYLHSKYSTDLAELGFIQEKLTTDGGAANYRIEVSDAGPTGFTAKATAVVDFNGNGTFNVWEINQDNELREVVQD